MQNHDLVDFENKGHVTCQFYRRSTPRRLLVLNHDISHCWGPGLVVVVVVVVAVAFDDYPFITVNSCARLALIAMNALTLVAPPGAFDATSPSPSTPARTINTNGHLQLSRPHPRPRPHQCPRPRPLHSRTLNAVALVTSPGADDAKSSLSSTSAHALNTGRLLQCSRPLRPQNPRLCRFNTHAPIALNA
ncbi:hypothetical protein OF83DRAFT_1173927 [Amylostereum chailletii]|nr:hypothetical protein OF83DRAFT_1173927 [Amylostereum chailletii]